MWQHNLTQMQTLLSYVFEVKLATFKSQSANISFLVFAVQWIRWETCDALMEYSMNRVSYRIFCWGGNFFGITYQPRLSPPRKFVLLHPSAKWSSWRHGFEVELVIATLLGSWALLLRDLNSVLYLLTKFLIFSRKRTAEFSCNVNMTVFDLLTAIKPCFTIMTS